MNELLTYAGYLMVVGGLTWLLVRSLTHGYIRDFLAPFVALVTPQRGFWPVVVMILGGVIVGIPLLVKKISNETVEVAPPKVEQKGGRDTRLSLTGARPEEFERLRELKHLIVLQWANPVVDDTHLELLRGMDELTELDLNDTRITDSGLAIIATLPKLQKLRLARTGITDEGFRKHLLPLKNLDDLDLTTTKVKPQTLRDWTDAKLGRKRPST
ncbi:hypothetical protein BH11PLA2_BH11PLA2_47840 [soil metagenome]